MDWRIKACIQGLLSRTPMGTSVNNALQKLAGGGVDTGGHIDRKFLEDWTVLMDVLRELQFPVRDRVLMEIGTGWLPVLPLCFALAGARRIHTFDLRRHMRSGAVAEVLRHLGRHLDALAQASQQPEPEVRARHAWLSEALDDASILARAGIAYHAPADATATGLAEGEVALVFSNSVLEHVPAEGVSAMMRESDRILAADGLALHSVNCGDHYAYFDRSITPMNYLRFDARQWRRWNNDLLFQNRLRPVDFVDAARDGGLVVVHRMQTVRADLVARFDSAEIAPEFRRYPIDELCTTSITFAARPSKSRAVPVPSLDAMAPQSAPQASPLTGTPPTWHPATARQAAEGRSEPRPP